MSFIVIIPSRYASSRLPGKALADIAGKPLIARVVECALQSKASRVIVATDDERIQAALQNSECEVCLTRADHASGSDRLAEVISKLDIQAHEVVVNVQGDEPFIPARLIDEVAEQLLTSPQAAIATAAHKITEREEFDNPNVVKVVIDHAGRALYFSRSAIPYSVDKQFHGGLRHIGIYAYRAEFLQRYAQLKPSSLEQRESLEQLRAMDNGETIMVRVVDYDAGIGVDTPADLEQARQIASQQKA